MNTALWAEYDVARAATDAALADLLAAAGVEVVTA